MAELRMCVVGFGRMGKRCARLFSGEFNVDVVSRRDIHVDAENLGVVQSADERKSLSEADFIFLAVPIDALDVWITKINELAKPECVVMECCTVRSAANEKLSHLRRRHFGILEIGGNSAPVDGEPDERISEFLKKRGCNIFWFKAPKPDEKPVAGLVHFIGMALDST